MAIIAAILQGERDPHKLAQFRDARIRSSQEDILRSLQGHYPSSHLFELQQAFDLYQFYQQKIAECDQQLEKALAQLEKKPDVPPTAPAKKVKKPKGNAPQFDVPSYLRQIFGVDLTQIDGISSQTALTVLAEVGVDFAKFKNEKHFASWLGLAPNR